MAATFRHGWVEGLEVAPRPGAKPLYGEGLRIRVLATLELPPRSGQTAWDGPMVAAAVGGSPLAIWRVLRKEGVYLQRQRSSCVSTDKQFEAKAADISRVERAAKRSPGAREPKLPLRFTRRVKLHHLGCLACHDSFPRTCVPPAKSQLRAIGLQLICATQH
jgi:hypothetical protein